MKAGSVFLSFFLCACIVDGAHYGPEFDCESPFLSDADRRECENSRVQNFDPEIPAVGQFPMYGGDAAGQFPTYGDDYEIPGPAEFGGEYYVLMKYEYEYESRSGKKGRPDVLLSAEKDMDILPAGPKMIPRKMSREECGRMFWEFFARSMEDGALQNPGSCRNFGAECYGTNSGAAGGSRREAYPLHCVPYELWMSLKPKAEDKCYSDADRTKEAPCPDRISNLDRDLYKSPAELRDRIQKCFDYKEDSLFVCQVF
jgi:hypothetical protein